MSNYCKSGYELQGQLDQVKAEQNKIKGICDNHFDEYEMGCLDLSDAIESLLERYDNAITGLIKQRKELKAENEELKKIIERLDVPKHEVIDMDIALENNKLKQTLTEVKELLLKTPTDSQAHFINAKSVILQKISEMKDV